MTPPRRAATRAALLTAVAVASALALSACASESDEGGDDGVSVLASFYPLQFVVEQVGGDRVDVSNLTPPAAEPHDLELAPAQVRSVGDSDLVVYLAGFQAAVDEAVEARNPQHVVDAAEAAHLEEHPNGTSTGVGEELAETEEEHPHAAEEEEGHDHGALDPHFWLDPTRLIGVADEVAEQLSAIDPDGAADYAAGAAALEEKLTALDTEISDGLAQCDNRTLVTSHEAFGYLSERYDLDQVGISGIDPEGEPSPARLRDVSDVIRDSGTTTIYFETLVSPKVTKALAADVGVKADVLDPLEGLSDTDSDYLGVMRNNLDVLRTGQGCA